MTQDKTGALLSIGRIPQLFGHAVLAAGVLASGASLLNAGGAMAQNPDPFPPTPFIPPVTVNGATIQGITGPAGAPAQTGDVEFTYNGIASNLRPTWAVDTDFAPNLVGPYNGVFEYSLTAPLRASGERWLSAALTQNIVPGFTGAIVRKEIFGDYNGTTFSNPLFNVPLSVSDAGSDPNTSPFFKDFDVPDNDGIIYVRDTYEGTSGAQLDNIINSVQTPGPLPILGAGAAFGFSRKLRGRIKAARSN